MDDLQLRAEAEGATFVASIPRNVRAQLLAARVALRVAVAGSGVVLATLLARDLGFFKAIEAIPVPIPLLHQSPLGYAATLTAGIAATFCLLAALSRDRGPTIFAAFSVATILWAGFPFARLGWVALLRSDLHLLQLDRPTPANLVLGGGLLLLACAFAAGEAALAARLAYLSKGLRDEEARPAQGALLLGAGVAVLLGSALGLAGAAAFWALAPAIAQIQVSRVNPVGALLVAGVGLAILVLSLARGRDVATGRYPTLFARAGIGASSAARPAASPASEAAPGPGRPAPDPPTPAPSSPVAREAAALSPGPEAAPASAGPASGPTPPPPRQPRAAKTQMDEWFASELQAERDRRAKGDDE